jgi:hypothetical protein
MATADRTDRSGELSTSDSLLATAFTRHDLVLAVIPSAFVVAMLVGTVLSLSTRASVLLGSLVGALALADALFVNPPETGDGR